MARKKQEPKEVKPEIKQERKAKKAKKGEKWLYKWSKATKNVLDTRDYLQKLAKILKWL
jgi:tRNA(Glu) U13 pseudouridine synthase TruD